MEPKYVEIRDIEPLVVDQTIHSDYPDISVRIPIYKLTLTHEKDYIEIRYRKQQGHVGYTVNLSPGLLDTLQQSRQVINNLPVMTPDQEPFGFHLGPIEHLQEALRKLKEYHDSGQWRTYFQ